MANGILTDRDDVDFEPDSKDDAGFETDSTGSDASGVGAGFGTDSTGSYATGVGAGFDSDDHGNLNDDQLCFIRSVKESVGVPEVLNGFFD